MAVNNHFKIIVPSYNNELWLHMCLRSVRLQSYDNYQCIIIDDCSSDKSVEIIKKEIAGNSKFTLVENNERKLALRNIYEAVDDFELNDEDIIVTLDGDDWFATKQALEILNNRYKETNCLITYGSYIEHPSKTRGKFSQQIPKEVIETNTFRESRWMSSHLRTFKYKLWKQIKKEDFLEEDGRFCDGAWDMIFMFPMLEMAGFRSTFIRDILHIYNRSNPLNEDKVDHQKLYRSEMKIRNKSKYQRLMDDN
jgi:glycosyltransferase involved in cell wall biosynthesis